MVFEQNSFAFTSVISFFLSLFWGSLTGIELRWAVRVTGLGLSSPAADASYDVYSSSQLHRGDMRWLSGSPICIYNMCSFVATAYSSCPSTSACEGGEPRLGASQMKRRRKLRDGTPGGREVKERERDWQRTRAGMNAAAILVFHTVGWVISLSTALWMKRKGEGYLQRGDVERERERAGRRAAYSHKRSLPHDVYLRFCQWKKGGGGLLVNSSREGKERMVRSCMDLLRCIHILQHSTQGLYKWMMERG